VQVAPHDEQDVLLKQAIYVLQQIQETVTVRPPLHRLPFVGFIEPSSMNSPTVFVRMSNSFVVSQDKLLQKELAGLMGKINESASVANLVLTDEELLALAAEAQFCLNDHELLRYAFWNNEARVLHPSSRATSDFELTQFVCVRSGCFGLAHQEGSSPIQEKRVSLARKSKATKAHQATPTFEHEGDGYDSSTDEDSDAEGTQVSRGPSGTFAAHWKVEITCFITQRPLVCLQEEEKTSRKVLVDKNSEHVTSPAASSKNTRLRTRSTALV
jgi:hypothetical protein